MLDRAFIKAFDRQTEPSMAPALNNETPAWPAGQSYAASPGDDPPAAPDLSIASPPGYGGRAATAQEAVVADRPAQAEEPANEAAAVILPLGEVFRPAFQVEQFAWSAGATRLGRAAGIQLDRLADGLAGGLADGRRVAALAGCRRGEGCTTLLLCAARRLAERGMKVMMVDADFDTPALGRRLGLLPETGWEDVLAGHLPVGEAVIESHADGLAVLPLRGPLAANVNALPTGQTFATLRKHYDLVLVDLGQLDSAAEAVAKQGIDAVTLVRNVRLTPPEEAAGMGSRLAAAGIWEAGVAENFVS
jgi:Mrp family chromosome partitioning ATPase